MRRWPFHAQRRSFGEKVVSLATFVSGIAILVVAVVLGFNDYGQ